MVKNFKNFWALFIYTWFVTMWLFFYSRLISDFNNQVKYSTEIPFPQNPSYRYRYRLIWKNLLVSVLADKKNGFIGDYRYRPIWKKAYRSYPTLDTGTILYLTWKFKGYRFLSWPLVCQYIPYKIHTYIGYSIYLQKSHTSNFELLMSNQFYHDMVVG